MKKYITLVLFTILIQSLSAQSFSIENSEGTIGKIVSVPVQIGSDELTSLLNFQFSVLWDDTVLEYQSVDNLASFLSLDDFGTPEFHGRKNYLIVVWENYPNVLEFNKKETLFTINFLIKEDAPIESVTEIKFCNDCVIEAWNTDVSVNYLGVELNDGEVFLAEPLAVNLLDFKLISSYNGVTLEWSTATEIENSHFNILHSNDGDNWTTIGKRNGHGNTSTKNSYQFLHINPSSNQNYYQLEAIDLAGTKNLSPIKTINLAKKPIAQITNPIQDFLDIHYQSTTDTNLHIALYNSSGQLVLQTTASLNKGMNHLRQAVTHLPIGAYTIQLTHDGNATSFPLVKVTTE